MGAQRLLSPVWLNLFHMGVGILNASILNNQIGSGLFPNSWHTRNIIRRISHQRFQLNDLQRCHLIAVDHILRMIVFRLRDSALRLGKADSDMLCRKLQKIPVAGEHRYLHALFFTALRHSSQKIVRLQACLFHGLNPHGMQHILQDRHLLMQLFRHRLSRPFISVVQLMAEGRRLYIEGHRQIVRLFLIQHLKKCI